MDFSKSGELAFLDGGKLITWSSEVITELTLCVDGDKLLYWGNYDNVMNNYKEYTDKLRELERDYSSIKIIPLYKKLNIEDCYYVLEIANSYPSSGFIKILSSVFNTDNFYKWLDLEKDRKKVG